VVQDLDECVLREVLGELAIAHHAEDQRENRPLIPPNQLAKRRVAPLLGQRDDIGVREIEEVEDGRRRHVLCEPITSQCDAPDHHKLSEAARSNQPRWLDSTPALGQLSPMPVSELETAEAQAAAAGGDAKRAYVQRIFSQIAPSY